MTRIQRILAASDLSPGSSRALARSVELATRLPARLTLLHVVEDGRHLFVSAGVGTSILPVRFLVVPRVDVLRLH